MKSYEIEYGKTAFEYLKDYASIEDKVNLKNFIKEIIKIIKEETSEFEILEGVSGEPIIENFGFEEITGYGNPAKILGKAVEISLKNKEPLKIEEIIRISVSTEEIYGNFLYQCAILLLKKLNIDIEKEITETEIKTIFEIVEKF